MTVYVSLRDEDVAVWRPVDAVHVRDDLYRILSANSDHAGEAWEFDRGDVVRCGDWSLSGTNCKVAIARVSTQAG